MLYENKMQTFLSDFDENDENDKTSKDAWKEVGALYHEASTFVKDVLQINDNYPNSDTNYELLVSNYIIILSKIKK